MCSNRIHQCRARIDVALLVEHKQSELGIEPSYCRWAINAFDMKRNDTSAINVHTTKGLFSAVNEDNLESRCFQAFLKPCCFFVWSTNDLCTTTKPLSDSFEKITSRTVYGVRLADRISHFRVFFCLGGRGFAVLLCFCIVNRFLSSPLGFRTGERHGDVAIICWPIVFFFWLSFRLLRCILSVDCSFVFCNLSTKILNTLDSGGSVIFWLCQSLLHNLKSFSIKNTFADHVCNND